MSFLRKVTSRYSIMADKVIKTKEPIKIGYACTDDMLIIKVDGIDYAIIEDVSSADDVDLNKVREWVEETYYGGDYKSSAYIPPYLKLKDFKK